MLPKKLKLGDLVVNVNTQQVGTVVMFDSDDMPWIDYGKFGPYGSGPRNIFRKVDK